MCNSELDPIIVKDILEQLAKLNGNWGPYGSNISFSVYWFLQ